MQSSLIGEYTHNIDDKGRLIIPSRFREALGETFVVTKGLDGCLFVFSIEEWGNFERKLKSLPISDKDARIFTRFFFSGASECVLDKQGRVMIPPVLRKHANLLRETTIVGVSGRLEIWNSDKWETSNTMDATDIADKMAELGI